MSKTTLKRSCVVLLALALILAVSGLAQAKSLFLIANINANPSPVDAYNINPDGTVTFQKQSGVPALAGGAVGIAMDTPTNTLFITYEVSNTIQLVDAKTMTVLSSTTAPGASNLAGIIMDEKKKLLYTVDRTTNKLYAYTWNAVSKTLTLVAGAPFALANLGGSGAFGIGLDPVKGYLYVANLTNTIPYYSTTGWGYKGAVTITGVAINCAVDSVRGYLYAGGAAYPGGSVPTPNDYLEQVNLTTGAKNRVLIVTGAGVRGVSVDNATGMVYITTGNYNETVHDLRVYTSALALKQNAGSPAGASGQTGLVVPYSEGGYNPLSFAKTDSPDPVTPGANLTYTLKFDNLKNTQPVTNVVLTDTLPTDTTFV